MVLVLKLAHIYFILKQNLWYTLKCKYSDCLFAISALPYFLLLYTILCYTIFDVFYILLGDDPMLLDQMNKINKKNKIPSLYLCMFQAC
jgi:hypothetical protein